MKFVPFESFFIGSPLKPAVIQERLEREVNTHYYSLKNVLKSEPDYYFRGRCGDGKFKIIRLLAYPNRSFLPVISGATGAYGHGSRIHVKMRLNLAAGIFFSLIMAWLVLDIVMISMDDLKRGHFTGIQLFLLFIAAVTYAFVTLPFKYQVKKARTKLLDMFDGHLETDQRLPPH